MLDRTLINTYMNKKILFIILGFIILIISVWYIMHYIEINKNRANEYSYKDKITCEKSGGSYQPVCARQDYRCLKVYGDGKKPCTSSEECEGECLVSKPSADNLEEAQAHCQIDDDICGCFLSVESFKSGNRSSLCID